MTDKIYTVLFLCTGNSARSIMAEAILMREGRGRFAAFSAGSEPRGDLHPRAVQVLRKLNHATDQLRSKSWDEFADGSAPAMDFVFTVCDRAARETCPLWPGQPMTANWPVPDPALFDGSDAETGAFFHDIYGRLFNRISIFVNLPLASLDKLKLQRRLDEIGLTDNLPA
ncbi:MAG: arsenate reductase ArsC [Rhodospirillales bacterium]